MSEPPSPSPIFATTHWSVVLAASDLDSPQADAALGQLCRTYWYPLYAFVRRSGHREHDAQDLTQGFFADLLRRNFLESVSPARGKFRSFLLASLKNFLADERDRASALKRGGGREIFSIDDDAEERYAAEPATDLTPDKIFERRWATTLLDRALARLRSEYAAAGKTGFYEHLQTLNSAGPGSPTYAEVAAQLGRPENTVKSAVHRLRKRYRELLREEIARTVASPAEIDEEIRSLLAAVGN